MVKSSSTIPYTCYSPDTVFKVWLVIALNFNVLGRKHTVNRVTGESIHRNTQAVKGRERLCIAVNSFT